MTPRYGLSRAQLVQLSLDLEDRMGYDSIPTIERGYDGGCVFPDCEFRTRDAVRMWEHVHFGRKHGLSFDKPLRDFIEQVSLPVPEDTK